MSYSIIRMQKMKSTAIKGIQFHNQRERESETNPDINEADSHLNYDLINGHRLIDYNEKINQVIEDNVTSGKTIRKDAVRLSEFLITSDREFFDNISPEEQKRYFETAHEFLADRYGEKNLIYATVHNDEKTPHMHVGFVPVTEDGRLSAKDFFGQKKQLVSLQDDFNDYLKQNGFELERGVSSSRKHVETAKYKAMTYQGMEKQSQEKYERTMSQIHEIDDKTKSLESIETKKALGLVGMKEQDYQSLMTHAKNGVVAQLQVENLQKDLEKAQNEVLQLKSEMKIGQDKIRTYYKDLKVENEGLKENLDVLAEKKALEKLSRSTIVKKYEELADKYNELGRTFREQRKSNQELVEKVNGLELENTDLKSENDGLKEKVSQISKELANFKDNLAKVFNNQIDRIKTFLRINNVDQKQIKFLDEKRDKFVQDSLKQMDKLQREREPERQQEHGMDR